jgi:hypothetical protein
MPFAFFRAKCACEMHDFGRWFRGHFAHENSKFPLTSILGNPARGWHE